MFEKGDVVLGCFVSQNCLLSTHYSVVLAVEGGMAMLVYTTSAKGQDSRESGPCAGWFSDEDRRLANWPRDCRYDASLACLVPVSELRKTGRISPATMLRIQEKFLRAARAPRATNFCLRRYDALELQA